MFPNYLALVSETSEISASELNRVAAALNKQATRDLGPIWGLNATVDAFIDLEDVPIGYWPIIVRDDIDVPGASGVHSDRDGQPLSLIQYNNSWSLTASHEMLEMLVDPYGNRLIAGPSLKDDQGRVEYLVEVADASEVADHGYTVNGILMSDFYTPHFFDPVHDPSVRYSYTGAITRPREVLPGGYITWHDPVSGQWWQLTYFGAAQEIRDLGRIEIGAESVRAAIDRVTEVRQLIAGVDPTNPRLRSAIRAGEAVSNSADRKAELWREQIEVLKADAS